ncbi:MAG: type sorting protein [Flaviaesturariibacter sp.]|nr:type sorting protein [Flaviaesturariibacter sp.]
MLYSISKPAQVALLCFITLSACKNVVPKEKGKMPKEDRIELAMKQEFMMTQDPALGYVPKERLDIAKAYINSLLGSRLTGLNALTWTERGPNNVAGRTRAVLIDTRDATGNTVIAGSVSGGIWRATNFKSTPVWTPVAEQMGSIAISALAQHPTAPDTMYAGTGEGWFNADAVRGNGIWKSVNGGTVWTKLASTDSTVASSTGNTLHRFDYVQDIIVTSNSTVFASARPSKFCNVGGIMRSTDGGLTWGQVIGTLTAQTCDSAYNYYGADLELASNGDLYATTGFRGSGIVNKGRIFRSPAASNGAAGSWVDITPTGDWKRIEVAVAPSTPSVIYALLQGTGDGIGGIRKSVNSGATWTDVPLPSWCNQGATSNDFTNGQAFYDLIVQVDPTNSNNVVIGGIDLFRSTDGGATWTQISQWAQNCGSLPVVHADQHNVIFYPNSGTEFIATNDGGVYYTSNSGTGWTPKNTGYNVTQFYSVEMHPTQPNYFLAGAQDNGTQKFTSPGMNATTRATGGDGGFAHIDQTDGNIQLSSFVYNYYFYSRNGGASFTKVPTDNEKGMFINPTDYDDVNDVLYSANSPDQIGVLTNLNGIGNPVFNEVNLTDLGGRTISAVKVDPTVSTGGTVWVAGYRVPTDASPNTTVPILLKLTGANTLSPTVAASSSPLNVSGAYISSIDVDPSNASHLLVTVSNYGVVSVLESTNGGSSWNNIEGNLPDVPVRWGMFLPSSTSLNGTAAGGIVVGTEVSVWTKLPASSAWVPETPNLPNVRVDMLKFRASDNTLAAATHGRGLWTTTLTALSTGLPTIVNTKDFIRYTAPSNQQLFIKIGNLPATKMQVRIVDINGRLVRSVDSRYADQHISLNGLSKGSYIIKIFGTKGEQYTRQFVY